MATSHGNCPYTEARSLWKPVLGDNIRGYVSPPGQWAGCHVKQYTGLDGWMSSSCSLFFCSLVPLNILKQRLLPMRCLSSKSAQLCYNAKRLIKWGHVSCHAPWLDCKAISGVTLFSFIFLSVSVVLSGERIFFGGGGKTSIASAPSYLLNCRLPIEPPFGFVNWSQ